MAFCRKWGALVLLALLVGCSKGSLDRETAQAKISAKLDHTERTLIAEVGRVGEHCYSIEAGDVKTDFSLDPNKEIATVVAAQAGYLTFAPDGPGFWKVTLTDKGQAFLDSQHKKPFGHKAERGCDYSLVSFLIAKPSVIAILGIPDDPSPEVEYRWRWNPTELGVALREHGEVYAKLTPEQQTEFRTHLADTRFGLVLDLPLPPEEEMALGKRATMKFKKYDDGWRAK